MMFLVKWGGGGGGAETSCTPRKGTFEVLAGIMEGKLKKIQADLTTQVPEKKF